MRQQFIKDPEPIGDGFENVIDRVPAHILNHAPWASVIYPCDGGYHAFESVVDAKIWSNQR